MVPSTPAPPPSTPVEFSSASMGFNGAGVAGGGAAASVELFALVHKSMAPNIHMHIAEDALRKSNNCAQYILY